MLLDMPSYKPDDQAGDYNVNNVWNLNHPKLLRRQTAGKEMSVRLVLTGEEEFPGCPAMHFRTGWTYAFRLSSHSRGGTVYEIAWPQEPREGSRPLTLSQRVYVWRDKAGTWRFLGEGAWNSFVQPGAGLCEIRWSHATVEWKGDPAKPVLTIVSRTE